MTFPPEEMHHGEMLGGPAAPRHPRDARARSTTGPPTSRSFEEGNTEFGGFLKRLLFDGGVAETVLKGPENPILKQEEAALKEKKKAGSLSDEEQARLDELATGKDINIPMTVRWTEGSGRAEIEIQGHRLSLKAGEWSDWVPLTFKVNVLVRVHGMTQFHVIQADRELQLYASPVNMDPRNPPIPISKPDALLGGARREDRPLPHARAGRSRRTSRSTRGGSTRPRSSTTPTGPWTTARRSSSRA